MNYCYIVNKEDADAVSLAHKLAHEARAGALVMVSSLEFAARNQLALLTLPDTVVMPFVVDDKVTPQ